MRTLAGMSVLLFALGLFSFSQAAPPKNTPAQTPTKVDADVLPPGTFAGVLVSTPDTDRMFTLKITYGEVRLKPGAKMPNLRSMEARTMQQILQDMHRAQQTPRGSGGYVGYQHHASALSNMMHQQQMYTQGQQRMAQAMARAEQRELQLLQQEIRAIQNMYQVVPVTRDFDFQADANVKVRIKDLPDQFDEKGNVKKYTAVEKLALKGKDKNLMGYESSPEALKPGQTVLVALRTHKKPKPATLTTGTTKKEKEDDKEAEKKEKGEQKEEEAALNKKMQVTVMVIVKDGEAPKGSSANSKNNKK
jgi:hypothetical protein